MGKPVFYTSCEFEKEYYRNFDFTSLKDDKPAFSFVENALVMPFKIKNPIRMEYPNYGGVFGENLNFVEESALTSSSFFAQRQGEIISWYGRFDESLKDEKEEYIDEEAVFIGLVFNRLRYGHFLLDTLSRLWFALDDKYKNHKICYICEENQNEDFFEFFYLLGLKKEQFIKIEKPTRFKKIIIPEQAFRLSDFACRDFAKIFDKIKENVPASKHKKIYFSRSRFTGGATTYGEEEVEKTFKRKGYSIFYPETLSIKKQISLLKGCESFAGVMGSSLHNALFAPEGIECIYLNRALDVCSPQILIDRLKNFNVTFVDTYLDIVPVYYSGYPHLLGLSKHFAKFLDDFNFKYSRKEFCKVFSANLISFLARWAAVNNNLKNVTGQLDVEKFTTSLYETFEQYPIKKLTKRKNFIIRIIDKLKRALGKIRKRILKNEG